MKKLLSVLAHVMTKERLERLELVLKIIAICIGAIWALYIFRYQNIILPGLEPTEATIKADFHITGSDDSLLYYDLTISIKNESKITEKFPASYFNISGYNLKLNAPESYALHFKNDSFCDVEPNRFTSYKNETGQYFCCGKILDDYTTLPPSKELAYHTVIPIKKHRYKFALVEITTIQCKIGTNVIARWLDSQDTVLHSYPFRIYSHWFGADDTVRIDPVADEAFATKNGIFRYTEANVYLLDNVLRSKN